MLPLLLVPLLLLRSAGALSIRVGLLCVVVASFYLIPTTLDGVETFPFIGVFLVGVLLAFLTYRDGPRAVSTQRVYESFAWACVAVWLFSVPSVFLAVTGHKFPIAELENHPLFAPLWGILIICMLRGSGQMRRLLDSKALVLAGAVSYSLYLWHRVPIKLMSRLETLGYTDTLPVWIRSWLIVTTAFLIAYASYVVVERPVQRWRSRRARRLRMSPQLL